MFKKFLVIFIFTITGLIDGQSAIVSQQEVQAAAATKVPRAEMLHMRSLYDENQEIAGYEAVYLHDDREDVSFIQAIRSHATTEPTPQDSEGLIRDLLSGKFRFRESKNYYDPLLAKNVTTWYMNNRTNRYPFQSRVDGLPLTLQLKRMADEKLKGTGEKILPESETFLMLKEHYVYMYFSTEKHNYILSLEGKFSRIKNLESFRLVPGKKHEFIDLQTKNDNGEKWRRALSGTLASSSSETIIPDVERIRDVFYNQSRYWPEKDYPYVYKQGKFQGVCAANSSLQIAMFYDEEGYPDLIESPEEKEQKLDTMDWFVSHIYKDGNVKTAVEDYANTEGYEFDSDFDDFVRKSRIRDQINDEHPIQYHLRSDDRVEIIDDNGDTQTFDDFYHSVVLVGYRDEGDEFSFLVYWGWSSLKEKWLVWDSEEESQFEDREMIKIFPGPEDSELTHDEFNRNKYEKAKYILLPAKEAEETIDNLRRAFITGRARDKD